MFGDSRKYRVRLVLLDGDGDTEMAAREFGADDSGTQWIPNVGDQVEFMDEEVPQEMTMKVTHRTFAMRTNNILATVYGIEVH
jgi:hypothetical protein